MNHPRKDNIPHLFREDYKPEVEPYPVEIPPIKSGADYYFTTDSSLRYQVLFARKKESKEDLTPFMDGHTARK